MACLMKLALCASEYSQHNLAFFKSPAFFSDASTT
jgi:hypothetical protein